MRSIKPSTINPYDFFCDVVNSKNHRKKDKSYKTRINILKAKNKMRIDEYTDAFTKTNLETIKTITHCGKDHDDYKSLYDYDSKPFNCLRNNIIYQNGGHEIAICPICENDRVTSLDHFLPKSVFPELSSHPLNLMPLCHSCNQYKATIWHNKGQRKCFNVYLDKEPKEQYLFCDILIEHGIPIGKYKIDGSLVTDKLLFQTIESTFSNLHLIDSYNIIANSNNKSVLMDLIKQMQQIRKFSEKTNLECKDLLLNELNLEPINKKEIVFKKALLNDSSSLLYIFGEIDKYLAL